MLEETGKLAFIWLRITLVLAAAVALVFVLYGWHSTQFAVAAVVASLLELAAARALAREWSWQARGNWWWGW